MHALCVDACVCACVCVSCSVPRTKARARPRYTTRHDCSLRLLRSSRSRACGCVRVRVCARVVCARVVCVGCGLTWLLVSQARPATVLVGPSAGLVADAAPHQVSHPAAAYLCVHRIWCPTQLLAI